MTALPKTADGNSKLSYVRLGYPNLFAARPNMNNTKNQYDAQLYIDATSPQKAAIDAEIKAVATEKWKEKAQAVLDSIEGNTNKICWVDGKRKNMAGYWCLATKRDEKDGAPAVVDRDHSPANPHYLTLKDGRPYAGCYVNATVKIWAWDNANGKGISCTLVGVQFHSDGDAFSATPQASADGFESLAEGADAGALV
ncbi:ssDNA-binding protein [Asticcacaulis sp.]|uniref:ssDNA-binding protein n=1 Tax=Asticcacaulis sp. TaxID=1872648 RepID=UPI0031D5A820